MAKHVKKYAEYTDSELLKEYGAILECMFAYTRDKGYVPNWLAKDEALCGAEILGRMGGSHGKEA